MAVSLPKPSPLKAKPGLESGLQSNVRCPVCLSWPVDCWREEECPFLSNTNMKTMHVSEVILANGYARKRGIALFLLGSLVFVLLVTAMDGLSANRRSILFALLPVCVSFAIAAAGFIEFVSGVSCKQLAHTWARMCSWQRGMIGLFLGVTSLVVLACVVTSIAMLVA